MAIGPYAAFCCMCVTWGTSYAVISRTLHFVSPNILSCLRMWAAALCCCIFLLFRMLTNSTYSHQIRSSFNSRTIPWAKLFFSGIINNGLPTSLMTLSQRTVTSVTVTISQPCVSLFALLAAVVVLPDEKCTIRKLIPNLLAVVGATLTSIPAIQTGGESPLSIQIFNYFLLTIGLMSFGFGTVYMKWALPNVDAVLVCFTEILASAAAVTAFCIWQDGFDASMRSLRNLTWSVVGWSVVIGLVYSFVSSILFIYVVRELGPIVAGFGNFGQIVIGVIAGVVFLHEWKDYSGYDIVLSIVGLVVLTLSVFYGFFVEESDKKKRYREIPVVLV